MLFSFTKKTSLDVILEKAAKENSSDEALLRTGIKLVNHIPDKVAVGKEHPLLLKSYSQAVLLEESKAKKPKSRP